MNAAVSLPTLRPRLDPRLLAALAVVYAIWGSTYLVMRVAVASLPPWGMAGTRFVSAGLLALGVARLRGEVLPSRRDWLLALPTGALLFVVGNGLVAVAEQSIASSVAAVVAATTPLFASAFRAARGERPSRAEIAGMALGLAGVVVLAGGSTLWSAGPRGLVLLFAPVGFALGSLLVRARGPQAGGLAVAAPQMICGGAIMLAISAASGEHMPPTLDASAALAWLYLVVLGSLVGFTAYAWLLRNAPPALSMSHAYVNPLVAVLLGSALGGEQLGASALGAAGLIAAGVMIAVAARAKR
ncbi:MAG: EamA family transporter [Labilithrix sp.]|nr:EamA family transporter [Labilithrix sp.]MCW5817406.1 EamA family transporter [Labilithrix sp.]